MSNVKLAHQPLLAGLKHLNRLEQVLVKQDLQARDCDDVLVADYQDNLIEASAANFFWMNESSTWCTPVLDQCGIAGVFRQHLIDHITASGQKVTEKPCRIEDLLAAKALFICNSLMQVVPVTELLVKGQTIAIADTPVIALQNQLGLTQ
jgi:4-amino-4-deoxychorismate lyase